MSQSDLIIILILLVVFFLFFTRVGTLIKKSMVFYLIIMFPYRKWHFPNWFSRPIIIEENHFESYGRKIISDVYRPKNHRKYPGMMVFAPLAEEGRRNPLVVNFLKGLARLGYTVTAPFWPQRGFGNIYLTDIDDFATSLKWFKNHQFVLKEKIGIVAVSYGTGPAMISIKKYGLEKDIKFVALISGFIDLLETIKTLITKNFQYKKIKGKLEPEPYAYNVMLKTAAVWSDDKQDKKIFSEISENATSKNFAELLSKITPKISTEDQKIVSWYQSKNSKEFSDRFKKLPKRIHQYFNDLSPLSKNAFGKVPTLILHSTKDHLIPYTESVKLHDLIKEKPHSVLVLISAFDHTMPIPANLKNIFTIYLPNFYRITKFLFIMLSLEYKKGKNN